MNTSIPRDAREIYFNEKGEPIAFCPKDSIGIGDLQRAQFYMLNQERLVQMQERARVKGEDFLVVCIDVDDPVWTFLVDVLMPGHDWDAYRARGEKPVARGVAHRDLIVEAVELRYPAASPVPLGACVGVFSAGGATFLPAPAKSAEPGSSGK